MSPRTILALAAAAALAGAGCGSSSSSSSGGSTGSSSNAANPNGPEKSPAGDIPDTQAYVRFAPPGAGYSVKVPEGWAQIMTGGAVSFTDKLNTVRLEAHPATAAPTVATARSAEVARLAKTQTGFKAGTVSTVTRAGLQGVRITYLDQGPADPVTGRSRVDAVERYLFFHRGTEAVLTLSGPKGADNVDPWRTITDSLRWTR